MAEGKTTLRLVNCGKEYKIYTADLAELPLGIIKKIIKSINVDALLRDSKTDAEFTKNLSMGLIGAYPAFERYLLEIFGPAGLTQEELDEYGTPSEIGLTIAEVIRYTIFRLTGVGARLKNLVREEAQKA